MKKFAPWVAVAVVLIAVLAIVLVPQLTAKDDTNNADVPAVVTATPVVTDAPAATEAPAADDASADVATASDVPAPVVLATVNGREVSYEDMDLVAQNLLYTYSQYGYDVSDEALVTAVYQMALEYSIQLELMEEKAEEWGFDQIGDEERAALEKESAEQWEDLVNTYITYYGNLPADASEEDKAAARVSAIAGLEAMGYTQQMLLDDALANYSMDKVEAEMIKSAVVTDDEVTAAFNEAVAADEASYGSDVAYYEYMTNYYGQTSYYQPAGYRGVTHILLEVDETLLTAYQDLLAQYEEQQEAAEEATPTDLATGTDAATPTDLVTLEDVEAARAAVIASVQPTIDTINQKLSEGVPFADLVAEFGTDPGMQSEPYKTEGYPVHMDSVMWDPVFTQAAYSVDNVGDVAEPVVGSYGVHIVQYTRDIPAGAVEMTDEIAATIREGLLADKEAEAFNTTMQSWLDAAEIVYTDDGKLYLPTVATTTDVTE